MNSLKFIHLRRWNYSDFYRDELNPKGGVTIAYSRPDENNRRTVALAICSEKDAYNRSLGRACATLKILNEKSFKVNVGWSEPEWVVEDILDAIEEHFQYKVDLTAISFKKDFKQLKNLVANDKSS